MARPRTTTARREAGRASSSSAMPHAWGQVEGSAGRGYGAVTPGRYTARSCSLRTFRSVSITAQSSSSPPAQPLTPADVAGQLGVTATTVRRWLVEGRLAGTRVGGRLRIDPQAVAEIVRPADETRGGP